MRPCAGRAGGRCCPASSGQPSYDPATMVKDAKDLIDAPGLKDVAIGGWSIGGIVAQIGNTPRNPVFPVEAVP
ncbi:MAG TPA: alpha/beta hydrolase [Telluria sp.]|nr:alpha/beta hydrolase [Telluria sp.]